MIREPLVNRLNKGKYTNSSIVTIKFYRNDSESQSRRSVGLLVSTAFRIFSLAYDKKRR